MSPQQIKFVALSRLRALWGVAKAKPLLVLLVSLVLVLPPLTIARPQITVIDADSNQPVAGVWVSMRLDALGTALIRPSVRCYEIKARQTDLDGVARFPFPLHWPRSSSSYIYSAYKPGYTAGLAVFDDRGTIRLTRFTGSPSERKRELQRASYDLSCPSGDAEEAVAIYRVMVQETSQFETQELGNERGSARLIEQVCENMCFAAHRPQGSDSSDVVRRRCADWYEQHAPVCLADLTRTIRAPHRVCLRGAFTPEKCVDGWAVSHCDKYREHCSTAYEMEQLSADSVQPPGTTASGAPFPSR